MPSVTSKEAYRHDNSEFLKNRLIEDGLIPLDKSWIIRMGFLDLINGYGSKDAISFIRKQENPGDDLKSLKNVLENWEKDNPLEVGESATLFRFFQFASWKLNLNKQFIKSGSLVNRHIINNPQIINYSLPELLALDSNTSQWASAAVLLGNKEEVKNPPYKLKLSYKALKHWEEKRKNGEIWDGNHFDETILNQAIAFIEILKTGTTNFIPRQAEDYCFARAFELISPEQGYFKWPSLINHESNRIEQMEKVLEEIYLYRPKIHSKDHRVVQAAAMKHVELTGWSRRAEYPDSVNKSWPQFWEFLKVWEKE